MPEPRRRSLLRRTAKRANPKDPDASGDFELPSYFVELPPRSHVPDAPNRPDDLE